MDQKKESKFLDYFVYWLFGLTFGSMGVLLVLGEYFPNLSEKLFDIIPWIWYLPVGLLGILILVWVVSGGIMLVELLMETYKDYGIREAITAAIILVVLFIISYITR